MEEESTEQAFEPGCEENVHILPTDATGVSTMEFVDFVQSMAIVM
jgi:hypothetical protein